MKMPAVAGDKVMRVLPMGGAETDVTAMNGQGLASMHRWSNLAMNGAQMVMVTALCQIPPEASMGRVHWPWKSDEQFGGATAVEPATGMAFSEGFETLTLVGTGVRTKTALKVISLSCPHILVRLWATGEGLRRGAVCERGGR